MERDARPAHTRSLLTSEEAFALSLGLRALRQIGLEVFAPATEGAHSKLTRVLPVALRESLQTIEEFVACEPGSWIVPMSAANLIPSATVIRTSHRVRFAYLSHQETTSQREVEPYAKTAELRQAPIPGGTPAVHSVRLSD